MRITARPALLALSALVLGACAPSLLGRAAQVAEEPLFFPSAPEAFAPQAGRAAGEASYDTAATAQERLVVQTASLTLVVTDPVASVASLRAMADGMGGFVVSSNVYQSTYGTSGLTANYASITIRVPSERLAEALTQIKADAIEVRTENISGEDVTAQYVDLESRLRNLEAAERQLTRIMDSAEETEDVLAVYNELVRVRGEIELVRGQMQYFEEAAALSAISVELIPDEAAQPIDIGGWQPQGTAKKAVETLIRTLQWLADAAIWAVICVLPISLLFGVPGFFIVRGIRRRRAARRSTAG
jgi:hypothetical protein